METTLERPNGAAKSRSRAGGSNPTTSQLELSQKIATLADLTTQQLRTEWRRHYRNHPPRLSRDLLVRTIAYRIQELAYGGLPSLGFDVKDKRLVINEAEAKTVRYIFRRYTELKSVRLLKAELDARGIVSKPRTASDGTRYGEKPLARGALYLMLQNRIYRGETVHKDKGYPGEHEAIVDEALWSEVQAILTENRADRMFGTADKQVSLLSGILFDARGERMSPTHATKNNTRYRYYVSRPLVTLSRLQQHGAIPKVPSRHYLFLRVSSGSARR